MFSSSRRQESSFSKHRAGKISSSQSKKRTSFRGTNIKTSQRFEAAANEALAARHTQQQSQLPTPSTGIPQLQSAILTIAVGPEQRLFACHEDVLSASPYFAQITRQNFFDPTKRIDVPDAEPEVFSSVLEFLYKGDYHPRIKFDKKRQSWFLKQEENVENPMDSPSTVSSYTSSTAEVTLFAPPYNTPVTLLKDTVIYCLAHRYGLPELQRLALRKQGLQSGVQCSTILNSARFAYNNTPDNDAKLRSHYLALIIRSRHTFKRSGTMQAEMEQGGRLFFDLFVAMVNHMVCFLLPVLYSLAKEVTDTADQDDLAAGGTPKSLR